MSIIGSFGICPKNNYRMLVELIKNNNLTEAEVLIKKIYYELKDSEEKLENPCSGEVFIALFDYFKTALGVDVRDNITTDMAEKWREITDDFDIIVLCNKEQLLSLEDIIDYNKISQYINDFFQSDYGKIGQTAYTALLNNLRKIDDAHILIWHLY
ncbi:MAG: hypothetical protein HFG39_06270 [Lachnospiraceae bacterium]|nr:hypothetical protein [Lachnospiraceae bacterium]